MSEPIGRPFTYHRHQLAKTYADGLLGVSLMDFRSGLFLTAPRRTGKSTFLREDLVPELDRRNILPVYVDLWADRSADPSRLIADAIRAAFRAVEGTGSKLIRATRIKKISAPGGFSVDLDTIGQPSGTTLTDALGELVKRSGRLVCLVVDEAQHAVTTDNGINAMHALKAARDALTMGEAGRRLALVFTGSHRDKLGALVRNRTEPFFGAQILDFPLLGRPYTDEFTAWVNVRLAADNRFDPDDVWGAFEVLGRRPEQLAALLTSLALSEEKASGLRGALAGRAVVLRESAWQEFDVQFDALTPIQQAVLRQVLTDGQKFSPFGAETLTVYAARVRQKVSKGGVQAALEVLRDKNLLWRSAHGTYAPEDQALVEWHESRFAQPVTASTDGPVGTTPG
ncbi:MAG TPA: ATP-binding protein [Aliidongia sp.]|uniref:ATP-binding protein n=1 Tax=Aliidongia sp. TaxID=1914230 RepID=UPI002DDD19C6|nr:ATP-binding protein [Aliidongia sp.]HEV2675553.1 ATP-binding protein [Aliidongia sp.]